MMQQASYKGAWDRYEDIRNLARQVAHEQLPGFLKNRHGHLISKEAVVLSGLDHSVFRILSKWGGERRLAPWDWEDVRKKYKTHPKRFELSIWHRQVLCGASIGRPTWSGNKLRLDLIEANPDGSSLEGKIADIVIIAGRFYAKAIGATQIRIMYPINDKVKEHYLGLGGFSFDAKGNFCYQDL